jgi:zeaxanthin glucosyltransferase
MARFLFVVVPIVARIWPAVAVGEALAARGHDVAWCGPESDLRPVLGPDAMIYPTGKRRYRELRESGPDAVRELWDEYLVPLNHFIRRAADLAVAQYRPDVVVADQYALAGSLAATKHGVPWVSLCAGVFDLTPSAEYVEVREWAHAGVARVTEAAGLPADGSLDLLYSPYLMIATTSPALTGSAPLPRNCILVGAALGARRTDPGFDWGWWDPARQHVLVTAGTLAGHMIRDFLARVVAALEPLSSRVQAVLNVSTDLVPDPPPHVLVAARVPMLELMPRLDALVCQAGQSTVNEAFVHGVPMVVAPIRLAEVVVASQVARAGAGVEVDFSTATPAELTAAVTAVLDEPGYRARARQISEEYSAAGGTSTAATALEALAASR